MARLIDKDNLMEELEKKATHDGVRNNSTTYTLKELAYIIHSQPVCDTDEVIEELEKYVDTHEDVYKTNQKYNGAGAFNKAIKIVKVELGL